MVKVKKPDTAERNPSVWFDYLCILFRREDVVEKWSKDPSELGKQITRLYKLGKKSGRKIPEDILGAINRLIEPIRLARKLRKKKLKRKVGKLKAQHGRAH